MPYVGIDAHRTTAHITVTNEKGQVLKRKQTASSAVGVRKALAGYHGPMKVVLETSSTWGSTYDWLTEIAHVVVLAHPANVRAIVDARIKSDRIDSHTLGAPLARRYDSPGLRSCQSSACSQAWTAAADVLRAARGSPTRRSCGPAR